MYEYQGLGHMLYLMLYGGAATLAVIACLFLLFHQGNAFAPAVRPPLRLRRSAAAFMASVAASHVWWVVLGFYWLTDDHTLQQLATILGTNRTYLGAYFTQADTTYNAYINLLRIEHFERLYAKAHAISRPVTAQELARESGFRSYSTFSTAFKVHRGMTVTAWMRQQE